jgi:hypothetical protein
LLNLIREDINNGSFKEALEKLYHIDQNSLSKEEDLLIEFFKAEIDINFGNYLKSNENLRPYKNSIDLNQNIYIYLRYYNLLIESLAKSGDFFEALAELIGIFENLQHIRSKINETTGDFELLNEFAKLLIKFGTNSLYMGNLSDAEIFYQESLEIYQKTNFFLGITSAFVNLGEISRLRGLLDESLAMNKKCLVFKERIKNRYIYSIVLQNISLILFEKGLYEEAFDYQTEAVKSSRLMGNDIQHAGNLFFFIRLKLFMKKNIQKELEEMNKLFEDNNKNKIIKYLNLMVVAFYELSMQRLTNLTKAQAILLNLKNESIMIKEYDILVNKELAKLYILELENFQSDEIWDKLNNILEEIEEVATDNNLYPVIVETLVLKAKIEFLKDNFQEGLSLIDKSLNMAKNKDLYGLIKIISDERQKYVDKLNNWYNLISNNSSFIHKIELIELNDYIKDLKDLQSFKINSR